MAKNEPKNALAIEEATTPEQAKRYDALINRTFVRIDPVTKKPHEEAKEFFWGITHHFRSTLMHAAGWRTMFQIQKYHRHKFYNTEERQANGGSKTVAKNLPYVETHDDPEFGKQLYATGERLIDAEAFTNQFAIDKTAEQAVEELMPTVDSLETEPATA